MMARRMNKVETLQVCTYILCCAWRKLVRWGEVYFSLVHML